MRTQDEWAAFTKGLLKAELKRRDITYQQLATMLHSIGVEETTENVANKINRGKFSAIFFLQCLDVIGCRVVRLSDD